MPFAGLTLSRVRSGLAVQVLHADETHGTSFTLEYTQSPTSSTEVIEAHMHESWIETFEVLSGQARYRIGRQEGRLVQGETVTMPEGKAHVHPWNDGNTELRVRQTSKLLRPDPAAIRATIEAFAMLFWLSNEGKVNARGRPAPLQGALILRKLQRHGGYLAGAPRLVQRLLIGTLAKVADGLGYADFDPRCIPAEFRERVE